MTIPLLCVVKSALDIPMMFLIFFQQKSFTLSMVGIHMHNFIGQGWSSSAILMLKTISDPRVSYLGISFFLVLTSLCSVCVSLSTATLIDIFDLDSINTPEKFGTLLTFQTAVPLCICLPFFYYSGLAFKAKKQSEQQLRQSAVDRVLESKKMSAFIKFNAIEGGLYDEV